MSFTRTKSGLNNYSKFFSVDITVFVEGTKIADEKLDDSKQCLIANQTSDVLFHNAVLTTYSINKKFKVKSLGSKTDIAAYGKKVQEGNVKNCLLIYDSDYECVTSSWVAPAWSMRTHGYSWESDLWTPQLCADVISIFSGGREYESNEFHRQLMNATRRIERLSRIEIACRTYGLNLIVPNNSSVGIKLNSKCSSLISVEEVNRLMAKVKKTFRACRDDVFNQSITEISAKFDYSNLVRGHLWEAICVTLIVATLKKIGIHGSLTINSIRNVALGIFKNNVEKYLLPSAQVHYSSQQKTAGLSG